MLVQVGALVVMFIALFVLTAGSYITMLVVVAALSWLRRKIMGFVDWLSRDKAWKPSGYRYMAGSDGEPLKYDGSLQKRGRP